MAQVHARAERYINAPPDEVYNRIINYRERRTWLPPNYSNYQVEEESPEGPELRYRLHAGNRERSYSMRPTEAQPGQTLEERDTNSSLANRWTVVPQGAGSLVTLETTWQGAGGIGGIFERLFAPRAVSAIHEDTLHRLDENITSQGT